MILFTLILICLSYLKLSSVDDKNDVLSLSNETELIDNNLSSSLSDNKTLTSKENRTGLSNIYQGENLPSNPLEQAISIALSKDYNQQLSDLIDLAHNNPNNTLLQYFVIGKCFKTSEICYLEPFIKNILAHNPNDALAKGLLTNHFLSIGLEQKALETLSSTDLEDKTFPYFQEALKSSIDVYKKKIRIKEPDTKFAYPESYKEIVSASNGAAAKMSFSNAEPLTTCKKNKSNPLWREACYKYGSIYINNNQTIMQASLGSAYQKFLLESQNDREKLDLIEKQNKYIKQLATAFEKAESSGLFTDEELAIYLEDLYSFGEQVAMERVLERLNIDF